MPIMPTGLNPLSPFIRFVVSPSHIRSMPPWMSHVVLPTVMPTLATAPVSKYPNVESPLTPS